MKTFTWHRVPGRVLAAAALIYLALDLAAQAAAAANPPPLPIYSLTASPIHSYEGGTPLRYGINVITARGIGDAVRLPPATGSGREVNVHVNSDYFVVVWVAPTEQINRFGVGIAYAVYPRQRLRFLDVGPGDWDFTTNLPMFYPIYQEISAYAGGGQANATYLGMGTNVIRSAGRPGDSVRLPIAVGGTSPIILYNDTPVRLTVYPDFGQKLNHLRPDAPYDLPPGKLALFHDIGPGPDQWIGGVVDAGYTLQFQSKGGVFSPVANTSYYIGQGLEATTYAQIQRMRVPRSGRISNITVTFINQGPGSNEVSGLYLRKNDTEDTLLSAVVKNDGVFHEVVADDLSVAVDKGDYIEIKWNTPVWTAPPRYVTINGIIYID